MSVSGEFWVLSGRGLCDGPITRPKEFYCMCVVLSVNMCNNTNSHLQ